MRYGREMDTVVIGRVTVVLGYDGNGYSSSLGCGEGHTGEWGGTVGFVRDGYGSWRDYGNTWVR